MTPSHEAHIDEPPVQYDWATDSLAQLFVPVADAEDTVSAKIADMLKRMEAAALGHRDTPAAQEAERLAGAIRDLTTARDRAQSQSAAAQARGRQLLAAGDDPIKEERSAAKSEEEASRFDKRLEVLTKLRGAAQKKSREAGHAAIEKVWRELIAESGQRRAEILTRIAEQVGPLLADLLSCDRSETSLYDAETGGVPSDILSLVDASDAV